MIPILWKTSLEQARLLWNRMELFFLQSLENSPLYSFFLQEIDILEKEEVTA